MNDSKGCLAVYRAPCLLCCLNRKLMNIKHLLETLHDRFTPMFWKFHNFCHDVGVGYSENKDLPDSDVQVKILSSNGIHDIESITVIPSPGGKYPQYTTTVLLHAAGVAHDEKQPHLIKKYDLGYKVGDYVWVVDGIDGNGDDMYKLGICRRIEWNPNSYGMSFPECDYPIVEMQVPSMNQTWIRRHNWIKPCEFQPGDCVCYSDVNPMTYEDEICYGIVTGYLDYDHAFFVSSFDFDNNDMSTIDAQFRLKYKPSCVETSKLSHSAHMSIDKKESTDGEQWLQGEKERFVKLMNTELENVSMEDLEWASKQDRFNSVASKTVWLAEIERRKVSE